MQLVQVFYHAAELLCAAWSGLLLAQSQLVNTKAL